MIDTFIKGASYPLVGLSWLTRPRLRRYVIIPLLINIVLFSAAIWWSMKSFGALMDDLMNRLLGWLPDWLDWLAMGLSWLLWPLFAVATVLLIYYTFTVIANLIASPFNGLLAEQVEDLADPMTNRPAGRPLWQEVPIALTMEVRKLGYFILRALPLLILFFIPLVNVAAPFIWIAFGAWMMALQYADYPMGNHYIAFRKQRRLLAERRSLALGFGAMVAALTLIPIVNFLIVPAAVIGATLMWVEQFAEVRISDSETGPSAPPPPPGYPGN